MTLSALIPAGVLDSRTEFFSDEFMAEAMAFHDGHILSFDEFSQEIKDIVLKDLLNHPKKLAALIEWGYVEADHQLERYLLCTRSALDNNPDIDEKGILQAPEFVPCKLRGSCKYEGIICSCIQLTNGKLTRRETEALALIGRGLQDKEICSEMNISQSTLRTYKDSIYNKSGIRNRKAGLAVLAYQYKLN